MKTLRHTPGYVATVAKRGVKITAKEKGAFPHSRVVPPSTWEQLTRMDDASFDGSCVLELGIGCFKRTH